MTSNLYWAPSRVTLPNNLTSSVAFGITTTLDETVILMAENIGAAADAVAGQVRRLVRKRRTFTSSLRSSPLGYPVL